MGQSTHFCQGLTQALASMFGVLCIGGGFGLQFILQSVDGHQHGGELLADAIVKLMPDAAALIFSRVDHRALQLGAFAFTVGQLPGHFPERLGKLMHFVTSLHRFDADRPAFTEVTDRARQPLKPGRYAKVQGGPKAEAHEGDDGSRPGDALACILMRTGDGMSTVIDQQEPLPGLSGKLNGKRRQDDEVAIFQGRGLHDLARILFGALPGCRRRGCLGCASHPLGG